ncbi:MAG: endonuclease/exonuclease/phosphatase family protein [Myxococcota bacterium]|nr:endonuclease/exonuclease/phosphatase family protein [Myxococcota bacterium]
MSSDEQTARSNRLNWLSLPLLTCFLWVCSYSFPMQEMRLYALQAICLTIPPYIAVLWPLYSLFLFWKEGDRIYLLSLFALPLMGFPDVSSQQKGTSVVVSNVNAFSGYESLLQDELAALRADYLIQIERRIEEIPHMKRAAFDKKRQHIRPSHLSSVYCREECEAWVSGQIGSDTMAMPITLLRIPNEICVIGIHAPPPLPIDASGMKPYIDHLSQHISKGRISRDWQVCKRSDSVLLMGDLNAVAGSAPYQSVIGMGLRDLRKYTGIWGATWPNDAFLISIPFFRLDHVFAGNVDVLRVESFEISNSDHKALRVWLPND